MTKVLLPGDMPGLGIIAAWSGFNALDAALVVLQEDAGAIGRFGQGEPGAIGAQAGVGRGEVADRQAQEPGDGFGFIVLQAHIARLAATGAAPDAGDG